ncbi:MAG: YeeE/YedE family protein [Halobacteriovoraceae bacterium]|nr:YeeE/YedE family protein [Halobacteriovoraceae bacterium]|tara:strand:+ start:20320 stop:20712 length:393 start_codon:yes stop_codon:yes gene_type:complete
MKTFFISLISGIIFAIGLSISGMINPHKVKGFLDIFGNWDYSLAFVMGGAVGLNYFTFKYFEKKHELNTPTAIDKNLIIGSALFGIGWGLIGICPGPGIVNLINFDLGILVFVVAMLLGMSLYRMQTGKR